MGEAWEYPEAYYLDHPDEKVDADTLKVSPQREDKTSIVFC